MLDVINGTFEACGFFFILPSILKILKDKEVKGVSWIHVLFFWSWGLWNLFYYPMLGQWMSFLGGIGLTIANSIYLALLIKYRSPHAQRQPDQDCH